MIRLSGKEPDRDIAIEFTGVRPGEKLHEELWGDGETVGETPHPKILAVTRPPIDAAWLEDELGELERLVADSETLELVSKLAAMMKEPRRVGSGRRRRPRRLESVERQPTRWTRRRIALALGAIFLGGLVAAALDLRFVIGGAPRARRAELGARPGRADAATTVSNTHGAGPRAPPVVRGAGLVWTVDGDRNRCAARTRSRGGVVRDEVVGTDPVAVAIGYGAAWVANAGNGSITRVPLTRREDRDDRARRPALGDRHRRRLRLGAEQAERQGDPDRPGDKQVDKIVRLANPPLAVVAHGSARVRGDRRLSVCPPGSKS